MKKAISTLIAACMLVSMAGCSNDNNNNDKIENSSSAVQADTNATQDTVSTTETTSQGNANSGDYVSSDSRITPVRLEDYWISDTQFDFINYCRDQGATVKYLVQNNDGGYTYCLPEELTSGQVPVAIGSFFYFGGNKEYVSVFCVLAEAASDQLWISSNEAHLEPCIDSIHTDDDDVRISIDNSGNTLSLSTINHLPSIFEHLMILPASSTAQEIRDAFYAYYSN